MLAFCAAMASCGAPDGDRSAAPATGGKKAADSGAGAAMPADTTLRRDLPPGRFHLPTRHTPAPDLFVTLPEGYTVKNLSRLPIDDYFIIRSDDPSLHDSAAITPGFMRVQVGVSAITALEANMRHTQRTVKLGATDVVLKSWQERLPDGAPYYSSEIASSDYFAAISPELARAPLHLYVYVAGRDSAQVAGLVRAAESIALVP